MATRAKEAAQPTIESSGLSRDELTDMLRSMQRIREFEGLAARGYSQGKVAGFLHLYDGQEASAVGIMSALRPDDFVMTHYRDHGHALARGVPPGPLMAELYGRVDGVAKGRGGSMHFFSAEHNFLGGWAIVGGHVPLAVGYAFATEYRRKTLGETRDDIGVVVMGDGSTNIGYFYEAMNFAALWRTPLVFVVENNGYAMGTALETHTSVTTIADKAKAFNIPSRTVDGMDVLAVSAAMRQVVETVRETREPQLVEIVTYRYRAHSMADPDLYRPKDEISQWRERDAIERLADQLIEAEMLDEDGWSAMKADTEAAMAEAVAFAEQSPEPPLSHLTSGIEADPPPPVAPAEGGERREMTMAQALNAALDEWLAENPAAFIMGEDINAYGSAYGVTRDLPERHGDARVRDTPIAEGAIVGVAVGAAMAGLRPIAELMTINFALLASDAIINHAAKIRSMFGEQASVPLVVRTNGSGRRLAATHSQNFEAMFAHVPGLRVAVPATAYDAKGLLAAALRLEDPTLFIENQLLYREKGDVPVETYTLPVGKAHVERTGAAGGLTLIGYSRGLKIALEAAARLEADFGLDAEVINLRWLRPLDTEALVESVKKTNRALVVEEDWRSYGVGAEIAARLQEEAFDWLDAPVMRVAAVEAPMPYADNLEVAAWPSVDKVIEALRAQRIIA